MKKIVSSLVILLFLIGSTMVYAITNQELPTKNIGTSAQTSSNIQTVTYEGSSNNYLSNMTITNYEISPNFDTTNTTYFVTVENDVTKINIAAVLDDETAKYTVYGNNDLKVGDNKVLVCVTAQNGSVRNYRIYVTRSET